MTRTPLARYESLLGTVDGADEAARVAALRRALRGSPSAMPPDVRRLLDREGLTAGYLLRHVLSIRGFAPDVRAALDAGLPLAVARRVNGVSDEVARTRILAPLFEARAERGALLPRGLASRIDRAARAALVTGEAVARDAPDRGLDGWLPPDLASVAPRRLAGSAWTFPSLPAAACDTEPLHPLVVEGLLDRILPAGGRLVDVTAGRGTVARVVRRHAVATWSGDLEPGAPFVRRADARTLLDDAHHGLARGVADALVVHPPTYLAWADAVDDASMLGLDGYADAVGEMLAGSLGVVRPGGCVALVTRPVREGGRVWLTTSHLAQNLADAGLTLTDYVVAVAEDGSEDWHLLVARVPVVH